MNHHSWNHYYQHEIETSIENYTVASISQFTSPKKRNKTSSHGPDKNLYTSPYKSQYLVSILSLYPFTLILSPFFLFFMIRSASFRLGFCLLLNAYNKFVRCIDTSISISQDLKGPSLSDIQKTQRRKIYLLIYSH